MCHFISHSSWFSEPDFFFASNQFSFCALLNFFVKCTGTKAAESCWSWSESLASIPGDTPLPPLVCKGAAARPTVFYNPPEPGWFWEVLFHVLLTFQHRPFEMSVGTIPPFHRWMAEAYPEMEPDLLHSSQIDSLLFEPPGKHNHRKRLKTELQKVICINYCRQKFAWMVQMKFAGKWAGKRCCCNHSNICWSTLWISLKETQFKRCIFWLKLNLLFSLQIFQTWKFVSIDNIFIWLINVLRLKV